MHRFTPCVVFPHLFVVLCWCDILFYVLCVFRVVCCTLFPYLFLLCSLCVHHTWVKQPVQKLPTACFIPHMCRRMWSLSFGHTQTAHGNLKKKKEKKMKWPDAASSACLMEVGSINLLFGQGLVCTCAGHTNWDVPLSALGLDVRPVLVGCSPLVWTLTSDIFWFHSMTSMSRGLISYLISVQRFVISEDWAAPQGLLQVVCVCEIQRRRETLMCVCVSHSNSVFLVYLHVSWAGQAL